ncbi:hypothetical protein EXIGLDRAFT_766554 [Exidia glandulosa HHB12029]|uniref:Uncharacterized protein n=1 Tax=Exidia glandulosa HHB12029 TaxID=1314781 RepID=A0A165JMK6_EXIGL|nr:hypothetical protein EXIGLDRAFT_766554 [Exidia glandulosa HHB12029]
MDEPTIRSYHRVRHQAALSNLLWIISLVLRSPPPLRKRSRLHIRLLAACVSSLIAVFTQLANDERPFTLTRTDYTLAKRDAMGNCVGKMMRAI